MLKKLLSILFLFVMTVGVFSQSIPSGTARFDALGYNPFIMDAATDINRNPAWAGMYHNYTFGDVGTFMPGNNGNSSGIGNFRLDNQYVGVNFFTGKNITLGAVFNKDESMWSSFNNSNMSPNATSAGVNAPIVPLKVLFSWSSKKLNVGLAPYYAMWSSDQTSTPTGGDATEVKKSSSTFGATLGVISHMKNNNWIEGNVNFKLDKFKSDSTHSNPVSSVTVDNTGGMELGAMIRGWFLVSKPQKINLVPYVSFSMFSWKPEIVSSPTANTSPMTDYNLLNLTGGIGINMPILDDGMLAGGVSTGISNEKYTRNDTLGTVFKVSNFILPQFNLGLEWYFTDWLIGRVGYSRSVTNTKFENSGTGFDQTFSSLNASNPDQTITLGTGWSFGRFSLDGLIGEKWFQAGPYLVSGNATDLYGVLSVSYNFNKK